MAPPSQHRVSAAVRALNLAILGSYGIHSSVFPSAHVSSAFSAAWALLWILPRGRVGLGFAAYAALVAVATVYGRYHYGTDALAGLCAELRSAGVQVDTLAFQQRTVFVKSARIF